MFFRMCFEVAHWQGDVPLTFANEYGPGLAHKLARWWTARTRSDSAGQVRFIHAAAFVYRLATQFLAVRALGRYRIGVFIQVPLTTASCAIASNGSETIELLRP